MTNSPQLTGRKSKTRKYGDAFIKKHYNISKNKTEKPKKEASTYKETLLLFQNGSTADRKT
jgi:ATP-dependent DNA helicase RecQ